MKRMAVNKLGDALAGGATTFASDDEPELVVVAGILGTLLAAPYHNPSDFAVLAPAAWLYLRATVPVTHWAWLAFGLLATYLAAGFGPGLLLVFTLGWLLLMVAGALSRQPAAIPIEPARVRP